MEVLYKVLIAVSAAAIGLGYTFLFKKVPDNNVEELSEQIIKEETGIDIDLSPGSKEK